MSTTGFTGLPPGFNAAQSEASNSIFSLRPAEVINLSSELKASLANLKQSIKLRGEVVKRNNDDSVRVRTEKGDIDIKTSEKLERGARIEIEVQPVEKKEAKGTPITPSDKVIKDSAQIRITRQAPQEETPPPKTNHTHSPAKENTARSSIETPPAARPQQYKAPIQQSNKQQNSLINNNLPPIGSTIRLTQATRTAIPYTATPEILNHFLNTPSQNTELKPIIKNADFTIPTNLSIKPSIADPQIPPQLQATFEAGLKPNGTNAADIRFKVNINTPQILQVPIGENKTPLIPNSTDTTATLKFTSLIHSIQADTPQNPAFKKVQIKATQETETTLKSKPLTFIPDIQTKNTETLNIFKIPNNLDAVIENEKPPLLLLSDPKTTPNTPLHNKDSNIIQSPTLKAGQIQGIITGQTNAQKPTIEIFFPQLGEARNFAIESSSEHVKIGTRLELSLSQTSTPAISSAQLSATIPPAAQLVLPGNWESLEQLQNTLQQHAPQIAKSLSNLTPSPAQPAQLGPAMMFFITALRGGDLSQWMGEKALDILSKTNSGALKKLLQEGRSMNRITEQTHSNDWRCTNIPLSWEGEIQKTALYYKHEHEESRDDSSTKSGTRFVFDLKLDNIGNVQIDGLFRPLSIDGKRLDLAVRTEQPFSEATKQEMRRIYTDALKPSGVSGELSFQGKKEGWVTVYIDSSDNDALEFDA
ncbi:MAG: hypothetical protein CBB87_03395 [Micavibrio sp. TMED27]|nr:hypothetical protein [Micavibrio sp.]OUT91876.1 MAG: hypothetical protein CBB87_03395 [Micavibrio sp. TMED27]|tara:strand:+ start:4947 stop:7055 length:2109 start_codon:yes stop_codon:yes gene_type:complete